MALTGQSHGPEMQHLLYHIGYDEAAARLEAAGNTEMAERLYLFDTTLRDGQQTSGVDFSLADKIRIANALDNLGLDYIEGGYPGANPTDSQFFAEDRKLASAVMTAFGMTKRAGRSADNDPGFMEVLNAQQARRALLPKAGTIMSMWR